MEFRNVFFKNYVMKRNGSQQEKVEKKIEIVEKEPESLSQRDTYMILVNMANRKLLEGETSKKRRKKVIEGWKNYCEDFFPLIEESENLFD